MRQWPTLLVIIAISRSLNYVSATPRLVCYFDSGASLRNGKGKFTLDNVDPLLCTHLIYVSVLLNAISREGSSTLDAKEQEIVNKFVNLKKINPKLKIMVSVGSWIESESAEYVDKVIGNQKTFADSTAKFLRSHDFDGLDISWPWEFISSDANVPRHLVRLLKALKEAFNPHGFLLSVAVTANQSISDSHYNIPEINRLVDFVNLKSYNMTNSWNSKELADHPAPLSGSKNDVNLAVSYWIDKGMSTSKLNMGIPFFGNSWTLSSGAYHPPAAASGPGAAGPFTVTKGILAYNEICVDKNLKKVQRSQGSYYAYTIDTPGSGSTWVGYDGKRSVINKGKYILSKNLGGAVVWDISMDDFQDSCGKGTNPLLVSLYKTLFDQKHQSFYSGSGSHFSHFILANLTLTMFLLLFSSL